jgi:prepilin-type N-terminal cleavage/methylation domain-containing protein
LFLFTMRTLPLRSSRARAFTLIELLTVIAIIGILLAIIIPTVTTVRERAERAVDASKLREILKAAQIYAGDNQDRLPDPRTVSTATLNAPQPVFLWPGILAKNNILTDPTFYFAKNDPAFNGTYPDFIVAPSAARNTLHASFTTDRSPSWEFVGGVKMTDAPNTPLVFTRGLQASGTWSATSGVYKDTGGFIAFLGGNVAFYSTTDPATNPIFASNNPSSTSTTRPTDIREAIPYNATTTANSARIYAVPPGGGTTLGSSEGTLALRGP